MRFQRLIDDVNSGNSEVLTQVYLKYRHDFIGFIRKGHTFGKEQIEDAFIDAILILRLNILNNRVSVQNSSVKTYLFAIGRNLLMEEYRRESRLILLDNEIVEESGNDSEIEGINFQEIKRMREAFEQLSPGCQKMLTHLYFHGWSYQDIQEEYNHKSVEGLRVQRVKCIKQLKRIFYGNK